MISCDVIVLCGVQRSFDSLFFAQLDRHILARSRSFTMYVASMLIANTVLFVDDADDDLFAKNIDALAILLREAGATYEDAATSLFATIDDTVAAQRSLLLLLRNRRSNDEKAVKEWSTVFPTPSLSYFLGSNAVKWAEGFVQRKNPVP